MDTFDLLFALREQNWSWAEAVLNELEHQQPRPTLDLTDEHGRSVLHHAVHHPGLLQRILSFEVPLDARDEQGQTALHLAVQTQQLASISLLLDAGASPFVADRDGRTPFELADALGNPLMMTVILSAVDMQQPEVLRQLEPVVARYARERNKDRLYLLLDAGCPGELVRRYWPHRDDLGLACDYGGMEF